MDEPIRQPQGTLERAVARFRARPARPQDAEPARITAAAFRASVEQRLRNLERDTGELKGRLNGLIFLVIGTVISQLLLKLVQ
jgi:hypothetical protein